MAGKKILSIGAESVIYLDGDTIVKDRVRKSYRIKQIDESLRRRRTRLEFNLMRRAFENRIDVPMPVRISKDEHKIYMEYIGDVGFKDNFSLKYIDKLGEEIAKMHRLGIIHGDLTTANMMIKDGKIYIIDFGLGYSSDKDEDKATDIFLLKNALETRHPKESRAAFRRFLTAYKEAYGKQFKGIETHLRDIESRRRYHENS
ncbi:MAG: KEOPS complex kinase/ATPase Bud32 [Candidatus Parvarchaeota archaeon]|nr:KEOPS complex kinase/ATPase Bud32 [Candidatus Parvarchaeota archaeon]